MVASLFFEDAGNNARVITVCMLRAPRHEGGVRCVGPQQQRRPDALR